MLQKQKNKKKQRQNRELAHYSRHFNGEGHWLVLYNGWTTQYWTTQLVYWCELAMLGSYILVCSGELLNAKSSERLFDSIMSSLFWNLAGIQKLPLFFNIFILVKGILYSARGVLITQKHLGILRLPRPWSYLISRLWSRFPLVISNQNLSGYCLLEEAKPPVSFLCDYAIITSIVAVWNVIPVNHAFDTKYFQSHIFQIHQLIVPNRDLESAKLTYLIQN